jgi:single-stranded DNA-binding protein
LKHGRDPRTFGKEDPTLAPSWKKQYCFVEFCGTVAFEPRFKEVKGHRIMEIALNWRQNRKVGEEWKATYHKVDGQAWNDMAEAMRDLRKRDVITVKGVLKTDTWKDKDTGKDRYKQFIEISEFELIQRSDDPGLEKADADAEWRKKKSEFTSDSNDIPW